jgi:hypothetical protein
MPSLVPCVLYLDCEILLGLFGWLCKGLNIEYFESKKRASGSFLFELDIQF